MLNHYKSLRKAGKHDASSLERLNTHLECEYRGLQRPLSEMLEQLRCWMPKMQERWEWKRKGTPKQVLQPTRKGIWSRFLGLITFENWKGRHKCLQKMQCRFLWEYVGGEKAILLLGISDSKGKKHLINFWKGVERKWSTSVVAHVDISIRYEYLLCLLRPVQEDYKDEWNCTKEERISK